MDNKTNTFQMVLVAVFAVFIIVGVVVFSKVRGGSGVLFPQVTIWGTVSKSAFDSAFGEINSARSKSEGQLRVTYVEKSAQNFDHDFIEALASGIGPDAVIISEAEIERHRDKIFTIPFENYPLRDFKDTYIDEAELFTDETGIFGLPLFVDPLVMYWNRDTLSSAGIAAPPKLWTEFFTLAPILTEIDKNQNIIRSTVALGEYENVTNAKAILSALLLQAGTSITRLENGVLKSSLNDSASASTPAEIALTFYTEFSNPTKVSYSWNRSMKESKNVFLSGNLAFYLGFASELSDLHAKNPNLNFDVASLPQPKDAKVKITYSKMYALAALKSSKELTGTLNTLYALADKNFISAWVAKEKVAPTRRDLLLTPPSDPDLAIFFTSALMGRGWLDPNVSETSLIFKNLVESISSGRLRINEAIVRASQEIDSLAQ